MSCNPPSVDPLPKPEQKVSGNVDLPPLVNLAKSLPVERHPDQSFRVDGLLTRKAKYLGKEVRLKGYLTEVYECPRKAKRCEVPHIWLSDSPAGGDKRIPVVDFPDEKVLKKLKVGQQYLVSGFFRRRSERGFVRSAGLIVQTTIAPTPPTP
jgi:hypothetical protein